MRLHDLKPAKKSVKKRKRVGRGEASGWGKTSGKGHKGQRSRSGYKARAWFEGGQMPLYRRLSSKGRHNPFKKDFQIVNVRDFDRLGEISEITIDVMREHGLIRKLNVDTKILGEGEVQSAFTVYAHAFSKSAKKKIEEAGGKAIIIGEESV